jgi:hypothetical protein
MHEPGWHDATITIRHGIRVNPNFTPTSTGGAILAVGDSFVFGDAVSDDQTWPAILERQLNRPVTNGGVSGYGTAQAVLRAETLSKGAHYSLVILSILVGGRLDLDRDRNVTTGNSRMYRPVVIRDDGKLRQTTVNESRRIFSGNFICAHPWAAEVFFWSHVAKLFFSKLGYNGRCDVPHPKAATIDQILDFAVAHLVALPAKTAIVIQYPMWAFPDGYEFAAPDVLFAPGADDTRSGQALWRCGH